MAKKWIKDEYHELTREEMENIPVWPQFKGIYQKLIKLMLKV